MDYYFDNFTLGNTPNEEGKSYGSVTKAMLGKFSTKKTEVEALSEAINLKYNGRYVSNFFMKADKLYQEAKLGEQEKFGLVREALKADQMLLSFVLLRG